MPHVVDGVELSSPLSSNRSGRASGCGYTNFEFVSASDAHAARFADANPVTTPAGTGSLPFVSIAIRNPRSWSACTRSSPNRNSGSGHVHCLCHAGDGASTTRSGRCRSQLEALGSGRVPPPIIIEETEMNATDEKPTKGRTAQYDWQNLGGYPRTPQSGSSLF